MNVVKCFKKWWLPFYILSYITYSYISYQRLGSISPEIAVIGKLLSIYSAFVFRNLYTVEKSVFSEVQKGEGTNTSFGDYQYSVSQENKKNDKSFRVGSQKLNSFKF